MSKLTFHILAITMAGSMLLAGTLNPDTEKRINDIILKMTLAEKANMLGGDTTGFDSKPLEYLGIPAMRMTDGPNGVRWGKSTAFPVGVCIAATWDIDLVFELGKALGREAKAQGRNVLLGPCVNIHRDPRAGRNFESYGEDPYLAARIAVNYVKGVQAEQVMATTKHFTVNNQEFERNSMDSKVTERVLREIYFPAFKAAVQEGHSAAIMSSYNRVNGHYASSNYWLLNTVLKDEWGFQGFVMSDWGAVHSIVPTLYGGLDIEMPTGKYLNSSSVTQAIHEGRMKESKVDEKIRRMLRAMFLMDLFEQEVPAGGALHTVEHVSLAKQVAESGIVLLKNENQLLPLAADKIKSVAVIGPNASILRTGGGGSSRVNPIEAVSPLIALQERAVDFQFSFAPGMIVLGDLDVIPASQLNGPDGQPGLVGHYFNNPDFMGEPVFTQRDEQIDYDWGQAAPAKLKSDNFSIRWSGTLTAPETGQYLIGATSDDGSRVYVNGMLLVDNWGDHAMETKTAALELTKSVPVEIRVDMYEHGGSAGIHLKWQRVQGSPLEEAVELAESSDAALLFMGFSERDESEGHDRKSNALPAEQVALIQRVAAVNDQVIVVLNSGAGVLMEEWVDQIPAILEAWYPGEQGGYALADILTGRINPSGKLVTTFFRKETDLPTYRNYPGENDVLKYEEGLFVGYRHYDKYEIEPLFPFGHGLSYTSFEYANLKVSPRKPHFDQSVEVTLTLKNTGEMAGAEVVQLYLEDQVSSVVRPRQELKAFTKVFLKPGEARDVSLTLQPDAMKFWDVGTAAWVAERGKFMVRIGSSSRDIRLTAPFTLRP